jgi:GTP cyclohydrolase II
MSDLKYNALIGQGIEVVERVALPEQLVPADAHVEMAAKKAAGYFSPEPLQPAEIGSTGRSLEKY